MPHIAVLRLLQILSYAVWRWTLSGFRRELNLEPVAFTVRNTATQKNAFSVFNDISFLWIKFGSLPPTPRRGALVSHKKDTPKGLIVCLNETFAALCALHLRNIVASLAWSASRFSLFLHSFASLLPPPAALRLSPSHASARGSRLP